MTQEEYRRKALEPIVNYIESVLASYSKEEIEARIKEALPKKESEDNKLSTESDDWSSFRREAARDILCALVGNKDYLKVIGRIEPETMLAIRFADELIKQLKDETK